MTAASAARIPTQINVYQHGGLHARAARYRILRVGVEAEEPDCSCNAIENVHKRQQDAGFVIKPSDEETNKIRYADAPAAQGKPGDRHAFAGCLK